MQSQTRSSAFDLRQAGERRKLTEAPIGIHNITKTMEYTNNSTSPVSIITLTGK